MRRLILLVAFVAGLLPLHPARAHQGPPFPILVDRRVGPYVASVWTDPDIGTGIVYVILEPPEGRRLPARTSVRVGVRPVSGRLAEAVYEADPQRAQSGERYFTKVRFNQGGMWRLRVLLTGPEGGGDLSAEVEATPDGTLGPIELGLYAIPFLAVGFLWIKAVLRRHPQQPG